MRDHSAVVDGLLTGMAKPIASKLFQLDAQRRQLFVRDCTARAHVCLMEVRTRVRARGWVPFLADVPALREATRAQIRKGDEELGVDEMFVDAASASTLAAYSSGIRAGADNVMSATDDVDPDLLEADMWLAYAEAYRVERERQVTMLDSYLDGSAA